MSNKYSHWGKLAPAAVVLAAMLASGKGGEALSGQETAQTQQFRQTVIRTVPIQEAALASAGRFPYRLQLQEERSQL